MSQTDLDRILTEAAREGASDVHFVAGTPPLVRLNSVLTPVRGWEEEKLQPTWLEEQLIGAKTGDSRELKIAFPKDYPAANLKGKDATFDVTVKQVKIAGEAKADDDFAKSLGLDSLDKLKEILRDQQNQELNGLTRTHMKRQLLDQLASRHDFAVPPSMVEAEYQNIVAQLRHEASHEVDEKAALAEIEADADALLERWA